MKKQITHFLFFIFYILFSSSSSAQAPTWLWANRAGGPNADNGRGIVSDASENTYVVGSFSSIVMNFGTATLANYNNSGGLADVFVAKFDAAGALVWAKKAGDFAGDYGTAIALDQAGNVYITGYFYGANAVFSGDTVLNDTIGGSTDFFVAKYNNAGTIQWALSDGGTKNEYANSIAVDASGNVYVAGSFTSNTMTIGLSTLLNDTTNASSDMFLVKYDSNGTPVWAKSGGGKDDDYGTAVAVDAGGSCWVTGYFWSKQFNLGALVLNNADASGNKTDIFLINYNNAGVQQSAIRAGGNKSEEANDIALDAGSNPIITGTFSGNTSTFGSLTVTNDTTNGSTDIFVVKYNTTAVSQWASRAGGSKDDVALAMAVDGNGNSYITGHFFSHSITINGGILYNSSSTANCDLAVLKFSATGTAIGGQTATGATDDFARGVAVNNTGTSIYLTGWFFSTTEVFGGFSLTNASTNYEDFFEAKLSSITGFTNLSANADEITVFPNPATGIITIMGLKENEQVEILDIAGRVVYAMNNGEGSQTTMVGVSPHHTSCQINISGLVAGVYILKTEGGVRKIVKY